MVVPVRNANQWDLYVFHPDVITEKNHYSHLITACSTFISSLKENENPRIISAKRVQQVAKGQEKVQKVVSQNHVESKDLLFTEFMAATEAHDLAMTEEILNKIQSNPGWRNHPKILNKAAEFYYSRKHHGKIEQLAVEISWAMAHIYFKLFDFWAKENILLGNFAKAQSIYAQIMEPKPIDSEVYQRSLAGIFQIDLSLLRFEKAKNILESKTFNSRNQYAFEIQYRVYEAFAKQKPTLFDLTLEINNIEKGNFLFKFMWEDFIKFNFLLGDYQGSLSGYQLVEQKYALFAPDAAQDGLRKKILHCMAMCHLLQKNLPAALNQFEEADKLDSKYCEFPFYSAMAYEFMGDHATTLRILKNLIFDSKANYVLPEAKGLFLHFIKSCYRQGLFDEVLPLQEKILFHFPDYAYYFIKMLVAQGKVPMDLIEQSRDSNTKVGPHFTEEARIYLNPCTPYFNITKAELLLKQAVHFTQQYGDAWLELIRLHYIKDGLDADIRKLESQYIGASPSYGELWYFMGGSQFIPVVFVFRYIASRLREEMRPLMGVYQEALKGNIAVHSEEFFAASPGYCKAVKTKLVDQLQPQILHEMIFSTVGKVVTKVKS